MSANISGIKSIVKTMLEGIAGLKAVYDYVPAKSNSYPYATLRFSGGEAEFGSTTRNIRTYSFLIDIFVERTEAGFGNSTSEGIIDTVLDEIITAFDNNTTLGGEVLFVRPVSITTDFENTDIGDTRSAEVRIEAVTAVDSLT